MAFENLNCEDRIKRTQIKLQAEKPFFAYLSLYLKIKKAKEGELKGGGMGVTAKGDLYYNEDWVMKLKEEELKFVLCHEISHLAFLHIVRQGKREHTLWNICIDLCVNSLLKANGFQITKDCLIHNYEDKFWINQTQLKDVSKKTAEELYDLIPELPLLSSIMNGQGEKENKEGNEDNYFSFDNQSKIKVYRDDYTQGFDEHMQDQNMTQEEKEQSEKDWNKRVVESYTQSKMRGKEPLGIERFIDELRKNEVNWRALLNKYIQSMTISDFTWNRRGKKSYALGSYLPSTLKERIEVLISIDTSGSIGKEELTAFLSEIIGISKAYKEKLSMRLLCQDVDVHSDLLVENGNIEKIKNFELKGFGGTSHKVVFDYIKDRYKNTKVVIFLTDGYSDLNSINFNEYSFNKIFVINKNGTDEQLLGKNCVTIKLKEDLKQ